MVDVYDNIFDQKFLVDLYDIIENIPVVPCNVANAKTWPYGYSGSHKLLGANLFQRTSEYVVKSQCPVIILEMFEHIAYNVLKTNFKLSSVMLNAQTYGMDGTFHTDLGNQVIVMCNSEWNKEWGGDFEYIDPITNEVKIIDYIPGRILHIDGQIMHKGNAPTIPYKYRYSLNFR